MYFRFEVSRRRGGEDKLECAHGVGARHSIGVFFLQWNNSYGMLAVSIGGHVLDFCFRFMLWCSILLFKL